MMRLAAVSSVIAGIAALDSSVTDVDAKICVSASSIKCETSKTCADLPVRTGGKDVTSVSINGVSYGSKATCDAPVAVTADITGEKLKVCQVNSCSVTALTKAEDTSDFKVNADDGYVTYGTEFVTSISAVEESTRYTENGTLVTVVHENGAPLDGDIKCTEKYLNDDSYYASGLDFDANTCTVKESARVADSMAADKTPDGKTPTHFFTANAVDDYDVITIVYAGDLPTASQCVSAWALADSYMSETDGAKRTREAVGIMHNGKPEAAERLTFVKDCEFKNRHPFIKDVHPHDLTILSASDLLRFEKIDSTTGEALVRYLDKESSFSGVCHYNGLNAKEENGVFTAAFCTRHRLLEKITFKNAKNEDVSVLHDGRVNVCVSPGVYAVVPDEHIEKGEALSLITVPSGKCDFTGKHLLVKNSYRAVGALMSGQEAQATCEDAATYGNGLVLVNMVPHIATRACTDECVEVKVTCAAGVSIPGAGHFTFEGYSDATVTEKPKEDDKDGEDDGKPIDKEGDDGKKGDDDEGDAAAPAVTAFAIALCAIASLRA